MNNKRQTKGISIFLILGILTIGPLIYRTDYILHIAIIIGLQAILSIANRLILLSGLWFMGAAGFYAIGAFSLLFLREILGLNYWVSFFLVGLWAGIVALGLGYSTSKAKGIPYAIITVAFVEVVKLSIAKMGGGAWQSSAPEAIYSIDFSQKIHYYYFILVLVLITVLVFYLIENSRVGWTLKAVAENEYLSMSIGINVVFLRLIVTSVCCIFMGIAGAFFTPYFMVIGYQTFTLTASILVIICVVVGGMGSLWGPVIGAAALMIVPELLPGRAILQNIIYAFTIMVFLFFVPNGIVSLPTVIMEKLKTSPK